MKNAIHFGIVFCAIVLVTPRATAQEPFFQTQPNPPTYGQPANGQPANAQPANAQPSTYGQPNTYGQPGPRIGQPSVAQRAQPPMGSGTWPSSAGPPSGALNPHFAYGPDDGMMAAGITIILLGYAPSVIGAVVFLYDRGEFLYDATEWPSPPRGDGTYDQSCHQQLGGISFIPVVGALLGASVFDACTVPSYTLQGGAYLRTGSREAEGAEAAWAFAIPSTIVQALGFGLFLGGALSRHRSLAFDSVSWQVPAGRVSIALAAPGSQLGLSVRFDHL